MKRTTWQISTGPSAGATARRPTVLLALVIAAADARGSLAYDLHTHTVISEKAAAASSLKDALSALQLTWTSKLDGSAATDERNDGSALGWIREGAVREDGESLCDPRVRNHFYNPLNDTGYFGGVIQGPPSVDWGLEESGDYGDQEFSYKDAKSYFWSALRPETEQQRQHDLALTFRSLGQVIHLVQDAAQPQHTRNDSHAGLKCPATLGLLGPKSLYEEYVEANADGLDYTGYPLVSLPHLRDYWDDERGRGVAEFSNRSFVSEGTNFLGPPDALLPAPNFPSPDGTGAELVEEDMQSLLPGSTLTGKMTFISTPFEDRYVSAMGRNPRAATYSIFTRDLSLRSLLRRYSLNRFNFDAAQAILLPRAVGYSAGLLDFFFRGRLEIAAPDQFAYMVAPYSDGSGTFNAIKLKVRNTSVIGEAGAGTIQAIVRYRTEPYVDPLLYPGYAVGGPVSYAVSRPQEITLTREFQPLSFDFQESPIPVKITDLSVLVAFRGPFTAEDFTESDAILFGGKDLYEPQLFSVGNSSDYDCYLDALYNVVGRTPEQRDLNGDGRQDLFGPSTETPAHARVQWNNPHYTVPGLSFAQHFRFVAVQDQSQYVLIHASPDVVDSSTGQHTSYAASVALPRAINRFVEQDGKLIHEVSAYSAGPFRGTLAPIHFHLVSNRVQSSTPCRSALPSQPGPMTEIPGTVDSD